MLVSASWGVFAACVLVGVTVGAADANALDRRVRLINESSETIQEFHASNTGRNRWEEDILGRRTIAPGKSVVINLDDSSGYCKFDFKTVMESGKSLVKRNVNICTLENYRITD